MKNYPVYSEKLNKVFKTVAELEAAEAELNKKNAAEKKKKEQRAADAKSVEDAFKEKNAAIKNYNTQMVELRKDYNKALLDAKKIFEEASANLEESVKMAADKYNAALKDFTDKHPEGYHMTLKDGDNVTTISRHADGEESLKDFDTVFNTLSKLLIHFPW